MEPTVVGDTELGQRDHLTPLLAALLLAGTIIFLWRTADAEQIYMAAHVVGAVVWVGGGAALTILALLTQRAHDTHALANLVRQIEKIAMRVFTPASLVTLGFGFALVQKEHVGYGSFWIDFALTAWALSFIIGAVLIGPRTTRLKRLIDARGEDDPVVQHGISTVLLLARIDVTMLVLVVIDMAAKPTF